MAQFTISLDDTDKNFNIDVKLDGETFNLEFRWSERDEHFFITVSDSTLSPIVTNRRLVSNQIIMDGIADSRTPAGVLYLYDSESLGRGPVLGELGKTYELIYVDADGITALR